MNCEGANRGWWLLLLLVGMSDVNWWYCLMDGGRLKRVSGMSSFMVESSNIMSSPLVVAVHTSSQLTDWSDKMAKFLWSFPCC